jgi:hypothetical protein
MNVLYGWLTRFLTVNLPVCPSELERLSGLVGRPSESHPLHNSGLLSLDPVQDKTPLYSQLLQAYKWSNKVEFPSLLPLTGYCMYAVIAKWRSV